MSKTFTNITGSELLRADSYSQKINITDINGHLKNLINEEQFWSIKDQSKRLYFDYKDSSNKGWTIEQDGWNDYTQAKSR